MVVVMDEVECASSRSRLWSQMKSLFASEIVRLRWDLRHLIYPLNYSSRTVELIPRQNRFFDLYEEDYDYFQSCDLFSVFESESCVDLVLPEDEKMQMLMELLMGLIALRGYENRSRSALLRLAERVGISKDSFVENVEAVLVGEIQRSQNPIRTSFQAKEGEHELLSSNRIPWSRRKWLYAAVGVTFGAATCGLTGGIAAPLFLPSLLSAIGMGGVAALSGGAGIAVMATFFGLAGAGMAGYRVSRRFADLKDFHFIPLKDADRNRALCVTICISGWIKREDDFTAPWIEGYLGLSDPGRALQAEVYCLAFEAKIMKELGRGIQDFLRSSAVAIAASEILKYTLTAVASTALLLPVAVLQAGDILDNPWTRGLDRARKAGKALAEALKRGAQGRRPVTLIGYSLGALVIFTCLQELVRTILLEAEGLPRDALTRAPSSERLNDASDEGISSLSREPTTYTAASAARNVIISTPNSPILEVISDLPSDIQSDSVGYESINTEARSSDLNASSQQLEQRSKESSLFGIIENVVLLGLPTHLPTPSVWTQLRLLVSGRFVHGYSTRDWVLKFLYRSSSPTANGIAGLGPIADIPGIENYDLSHVVDGHLEYQNRLVEILQYVDI